MRLILLVTHTIAAVGNLCLLKEPIVTGPARATPPALKQVKRVLLVYIGPCAFELKQSKHFSLNNILGLDVCYC